MKKYTCIHLVLLLLFTGTASYSQHSFAPIGAEWWFYYNTSVNWESPSYQRSNTCRARSVGDTIVDGTACRKVTVEAYVQTKYFSPDSLVNETHIKDYYFYDNTDTVFVYNAIFQRFTPIYIFNAQEGDTVCLPVVESPLDDNPINPITGDTSFCFVVDSIRQVQYDTTWLKTFYTNAIEIPEDDSPLHRLTFSWNGTGGKEAYIERIIGGFFPLRMRNCVDCTYFPMNPGGRLRCYSDGSTHIKLVPEPCDTFYSLGISQTQTAANILKIYPNPAGDQFHILLKQNAQADIGLTITDIAGRIVLQTTLVKQAQQKTMSTATWAEGLYFLRFQTADGIYYDKIVIRHGVDRL